MSEQWTRDTGDRHEHVSVSQHGAVERRQEIVEDVATARYEALTKITQLIWLFFGLLEALIGLRVILKLIAANPANPFASLVYSITDLFLWPFFGLTVTPEANGIVLEISSIIAMIVYAVFAWALVKFLWLVFYRTPTRSVSTYERDRRP
jgi:hypothetical protein